MHVEVQRTKSRDYLEKKLGWEWKNSPNQMSRIIVQLYQLKQWSESQG